MVAGKKLWRSLEAELNADLEWNEGGALYASGSTDIMAYREKWVETARPFGLDTQLLSKAEVANLLPGLASPIKGGLYTKSDGHAEPRKVAAAFAQRARDLGTAVLEGCGALAIELAGGRVAGVATEWGQIKANIVLLCAGASSWRLLKSLGVSLPQSYVRGSVARTNILPHVTDAAFVGDGIAFRKRRDGSFNIASSMHGDVDVGLDHLRLAPWYWSAYRDSAKGLTLHPGALVQDIYQRMPWREESRSPAIHVREPITNPQQARLQDAARLLERAFPGIGHVGIAEQWAGNIDTLPDGIPVLDAPAATPGLLVATGFCGHGFALGPIVGKTMTALAQGTQSEFNLRPFRLSRFAEGDVKQPLSIW
jgi:glycine/D-amino acid oxidase-like deaminating enzyme